MPSTFSFADQTFTSDTYLALSDFAPISGSSTLATASAPFQAIDPPGDVDVIALTLLAGRTYSFDIDDGYGDPTGGSVDLAIDLIDSRGALIQRDGSGSSDNGSYSPYDPYLSVRVDVSGTYYLAVHSEGVQYIDNEFRFSGTGGTGDYELNVIADGIADVRNLGDGDSNAFGTDYSDNIRGNGGDDFISLYGDSDLGSGGRGYDTLYGGSGSDELSGGAGTDKLYGGTGSDVLIGGAGNDRLDGLEGLDTLNGGTNRDRLLGGDQDDRLFGGAGRDELRGGTGDDYIRGGSEVDQMWGGSGADRFHFLRGDSDYDQNAFDEDLIHDFSTADVIDLSDLSSIRLDFIGSAGFDSSGYEVRVQDFRASRGFQEVQVNLGGDTTPELAFKVDTTGGFRLIESDFLL